MAFLLGLLSSGSVGLAGDLDGREIMRRAFATDELNEKLARSYTFQERAEERNFDKKGKVKSSKSKTYDVTLLDGSVYQQLIARNDQSLAPEEEEKEQRRLRKSIERMQKETPAQREKRRVKERKKKERERKFVGEIRQAFDFRILGEERINGTDTYIIGAEPKPNWKPQFKRAQFLSKFHGKFWIAKSDFGWVKVEAETLDKVTFGWFLFRLNRGARLFLEQTRVRMKCGCSSAFACVSRLVSVSSRAITASTSIPTTTFGSSPPTRSWFRSGSLTRRPLTRGGSPRLEGLRFRQPRT